MARKSLGYVNLEWICPRCGSKNPGTQKTCVSCGGPQPEETAFQQSDGQPIITGEEAEKLAKKGADIICAFCSTRNPGDAAVCSNCGADLKAGKRREAGAVLGTFQAASGAETMACPNCGQANPKTALKCAACGASLAVEAAKPPAPAAKTPTKLNPVVIVIGALVLLALIVVCVVSIINATKTEALTGTVSDVAWQTSVAVEEYMPVEDQDWKDEIPAGAVVGTCDLRYANTSDSPAPISTEVCGEPYTVDQGNGVAEVVQDCTYEVYEEYCTYTSEQWTVVDTLSLQGADLSPQVSNPALSSQQRLGTQSEEYSITFDSPQGELIYTTSDESVFQQAEIGSQWTLQVNNSGSVRSIEPAQ